MASLYRPLSVKFLPLNKARRYERIDEPTWFVDEMGLSLLIFSHLLDAFF